MDSEDLASHSTQILRIGGPVELLHAVPYLLGFHPRSSLVLVGLRGSKLVLTVRLGLGDLAESGVLAEAVEAIRRAQATDIVGVVFHERAVDPGASLPWSGLVETLREQAARAGCALVDTLLVSGGAWWSYSCPDRACCPPQGNPLGGESTAFAAAATFAGMVALPDRDALVAVLQPNPDGDRTRLTPLIAGYENMCVRAILDGSSARHERSETQAIVAAARVTDEALTSADTEVVTDACAARFVVALSTISIRDSIWMTADDGRIDGRRLWRELARRVPSPYDAAPLFLHGWCSWRVGNGALARIACELAMASDPSYSAAQLLLAAIRRGVNPQQLPKLRRAR